MTLVGAREIATPRAALLQGERDRTEENRFAFAEEIELVLFERYRVLVRARTLLSRPR